MSEFPTPCRPDHWNENFESFVVDVNITNTDDDAHRRTVNDHTLDDRDDDGDGDDADDHDAAEMVPKMSSLWHDDINTGQDD